MNTNDVKARIRRLRQLSDGFDAEMAGLKASPGLLRPMEVIVYTEALVEAQKGVDRARQALEVTWDRMRS